MIPAFARCCALCCLLLSLPAAEVVRAAEAPDEATVITYALWGGPDDVANARRFAEGFVDGHPEIAVKIAVYPWGQYWAKLQTQCAAGLAPDVISLYSAAMGVWIARGALEPLDGYVEASGLQLADYHNTAIATCRWVEDDGAAPLYAFPMEMAVRLLAYDTAKLEQAGIPCEQWPSSREPMSWDAFRALCKQLTLRDVDGSVIQYGAHYGYDWERSMLGIHGGTLFDRDTNPTASSVQGDEGLERALIEIFQQQYAHGSMMGRIPLSSGLQSGADNALLSGRFAMGTTGSWALPGLQEAGLRLGLAPMPEAERSGHRITVNALGIFADSPRKQAAWAFIRYMASTAVQPVFGRSLKGVPALKSAAQSIVDNQAGVPDCEAFLAAVARARPLEVMANTDVPGAVGRWFSSLETGLDNHYDQRFRALERPGGALPPARLDAFVAEMEEHVAATVKARLPELHTAIEAGFARAANPQPGALIGIVLPAALLGLVVALGWLLLVVVRRLQAPLRHGLHRPAAGWIALAPWLVGLVCFGLGPILAALAISFTQWNMIDEPRWVGLVNYLRMFSDERFWAALGRTLGYAALVIPISLGGGLFTAALLTCDIRGRDAFKAILYLPSLFTGAAAAVLWVNMFNKEFGVVNRLLGWVGVAPVSWLDEGHAFFTVVLMNVFWIGGAMIIYYAGIKQIPKSLYEAAKVDGAGPVRSFVSITIPMLSPVILFLVVMSTITAFQIFTPALFVAESSYAIGSPGDSLRFYSVNIYDEAFNNLRMGRACAQALVLFVVIFAITMVQLTASKRFVHTEAEA